MRNKKRTPKSKWWIFEELSQELQDSHPNREDYDNVKDYHMAYDRWKFKAKYTNPEEKKRLKQASVNRVQRLSPEQQEQKKIKDREKQRTPKWRKYNTELQRTPKVRKRQVAYQRKRRISELYGEEFLDLVLMIYKLGRKIKELKDGNKETKDCATAS